MQGEALSSCLSSHNYSKTHSTHFQVCEVYKLHRETFYLAQDFFDRYMATQQDVVKTLLQLIGISSLFIAAKLEVRGRQLLVTRPMPLPGSR